MVSSGSGKLISAQARPWIGHFMIWTSVALERLLVPAGAIILSIVIFGLFVALVGTDPLDVFSTIYDGAFGSWFSWQNTLERAAPLLLTGLCTALPARLGLIIIGGEGGYVVGAVATV